MTLMSNLKLFCFGYYFPPSRAPEAIVSAKRTVGLKGYDVTFVSFRLGEEDQQLADYASRRFHCVVRLPLPLWMRALPRKILTRLPGVPDWLALVKSHAAAKLKSLGVASQNVFMTCSQSHSSHLVGLEVKKAYPELPWVAHFSDPWASNEYLSDEENKRQRSLEEEVFEAADLLIFTSEETLEQVGQVYPERIRSKMRVLPHAYDPDLWMAKPQVSSNESKSGTLVVRHIGALYGKRSPNSFFEALQILAQDTPELLKGIRFEFIGPIDAEFIASYEACNLLSGILAVRSPVSYLESLRLMQDSDALMVIDAPSEKSIFLPSKLIDYVGVGKPIFAVSPPGTTSSLVRRYGGRCCHPDDVQQIFSELKIFLNDLRDAQDTSAMINDAVRDQFHVDKVGVLLQSYLAEVQRC